MIHVQVVRCFSQADGLVLRPWVAVRQQRQSGPLGKDCLLEDFGRVVQKDREPCL